MRIIFNLVLAAAAIGSGSAFAQSQSSDEQEPETEQVEVSPAPGSKRATVEVSGKHDQTFLDELKRINRPTEYYTTEYGWPFNFYAPPASNSLLRKVYRWDLPAGEELCSLRTQVQSAHSREDLSLLLEDSSPGGSYAIQVHHLGKYAVQVGVAVKGRGVPGASGTRAKGTFYITTVTRNTPEQYRLKLGCSSSSVVGAPDLCVCSSAAGHPALLKKYACYSKDERDDRYCAAAASFAEHVCAPPSQCPACSKWEPTALKVAGSIVCSAPYPPPSKYDEARLSCLASAAKERDLSSKDRSAFMRKCLEAAGFRTFR